MILGFKNRISWGTKVIHWGTKIKTSRPHVGHQGQLRAEPKRCIHTIQPVLIFLGSQKSKLSNYVQKNNRNGPDLAGLGLAGLGQARMATSKSMRQGMCCLLAPSGRKRVQCYTTPPTFVDPPELFKCLVVTRGSSNWTHIFTGSLAAQPGLTWPGGLIFLNSNLNTLGPAVELRGK